jgi:hypothetical protein
MLHNFGPLQIESHNLKKMWQRVARQFAADVHGIVGANSQTLSLGSEVYANETPPMDIGSWAASVRKTQTVPMPRAESGWPPPQNPGYHVDRQTAERSYDWFEDAVEQFMRDATKAGYFDPITGPEESELERHRPQKD